MKQTTVNEFKDGLNLDLHPLVTPKTVLTDNLNGTFITYNGNEFCLQNDRGNKIVGELNSGYIPIGIKEHNGILYIVSVNGNSTEIGTFPAPHYPNIWNDNLYDEEWHDSFKDGNGNFHYDALHVLEEHEPFRVSGLDYDVEHPVTIEIQDSYDGSVNLILVADGLKTRIVNSGFSVLPNNEYKFINRNQTVETNVYDEDVIKDTELIRTSDILTNIKLLGVQSGGQWKGGNYTFYVKFGDADYNQTDVVAESGIVSIFNGNDGMPSTISGTLLDERTDKMIHLAITGLNHVYSKIYVYYSREYSDTQGYRMTEYGMLSEPIDMPEDVESEDYIPIGSHIDPATGTVVTDAVRGKELWLTGFEQTSPINSEELNVDYHTIDWARAEAQHSNMLFLGNVGQKGTFKLYERLRDKSKNITATYSLDSLPAVTSEYVGGTEYYSVSNIYNKVGYYPGEIYRFGIVYILNDGSKTPVFNVPGWNFQVPIYEGQQFKGYEEIGNGVCLMPKEKVITVNSINPIYLTFTIPELEEPDVIGWFIVRQKRIPNTICEGLSIATDTISNTPMMWDGSNWVTQSFLSSKRETPTEIVQLEYNSAQSDIEIDVNERQTFSEWLESKNHTYLPYYWLDLNETGDMYYLPSDFVWNQGETPQVTITRAVSAIVDSLNLNRDYVVYDFTMTQNVNDAEETQSHNEQINALQNGAVSLHWYQKYVLSSTEDGIPVDTPTEEYLVGIIGNVKEAYDKNSINVSVSQGNAMLYGAWKGTYDRMYGNGTLDKKFIKNTVSFGKESNSILSLDPCVKNEIGSMLDGSNYTITLERELTINSKNNQNNYKSVFTTNIIESETTNSFDSKCVFIPSNTGVKVVDEYEFSNVAGNAADIKQYKTFSTPFFLEILGAQSLDNTDLVLLNAFDFIVENLELLQNYLKDKNPDERREFYSNFYNLVYGSNKNINLLRGLFTPYIGLANNDEIPFGIYSIKHKSAFNNGDFLIREQDNSEYYCVSEYTNSNSINVFRGDCFTNTITMRMIRNFIDNTAPVSDMILDPDGWHNFIVARNKEATDEKAKISYADVNLSDVNTVDLGYWVTFKCLSSYNLGLRSVDRLHVDEVSLMGSPRSFYPLNGASTATGNKMEESFLLNDGLSATVGRKRYNFMPKIPYSKSEFSNRIMFSNINVTDSFTNGYRTFQGLSYKDYDKQYGAITKLISLGQNLFVVMEHGLGLVPVNPKALMQTTTGEAIHIYGYGVLPNEMTIISQDYGSKYEHSVIRTPIGIYGMDVDTKKIWRFSDRQGFETISDMKIETYLKDNLNPLEINIGNADIRTHYNGKKGDLMFTWYCNGEIYSICYNERQNIWVTRYDWCPIVSENINDEFHSLNTTHIWDHADDVGYNNGYVSSWYGQPHGFEFEFVVSDPIGVNKIFDNLQIISNNVQPNEMEITIIGDDYEFKRDIVDFQDVDARRDWKLEVSESDPSNVTTTSNIHGREPKLEKIREGVDNPKRSTTYKFDERLKQSVIIKQQLFKDIYKFGRRLGNIQYKEGTWFAQIEPLLINSRKEARIKDKWAKIRIKYSGENLAIIAAIKTLINV